MAMLVITRWYQTLQALPLCIVSTSQVRRSVGHLFPQRYVAGCYHPTWDDDSIWRSIPLSSCASTLPTNACSRCWEAPEKWAISPHSLVGALEHFFIFPFSWECHHPNWLTTSFFRWVGIPPTSSARHFWNWIVVSPADHC